MKKLLLLISILLAVGIITGRAQSRVLEKQIVDKLIVAGEITQQTVKERGGFHKIIDIKHVELNKEGKQAFIVNCACENSATIYVMRHTARGIDIIFSGAQRQDITPLKTYTKGWRDLRLKSYSAGTGESSSEILRWNGSVYR